MFICDRTIARCLLLSSLLAVACGGRAEEQVLRGYFDSCAIADDVALSNTSLVSLDPRRDGTVGRFRIITIHPEVLQPASVHPRAVHLSLQDPGRAHDEQHAVLVTETLELSAEMHRDGRTARQPMTVTLARARTPETVGRWIVVRLVLGGRTLPEASSGPR